MDNNEKSIKINMLLNAIKGIMGIVFPLITFPYISRVLGVEGVGKYNFSSSVISYFVLLAGLGIGTYAIREGAAIRDSKSRIKEFADEMFSLNIISTIVSYCLLFLLLVLIPKLQNYKIILEILSLQIVFKTIGVEWIYSIYEDYAYITITSIFFQCASLILLFTFVHDASDIDMYALITVISSAGANVINYMHSKKYCTITFTYKFNWKKHIRSIMILFATTVAVTIYVNSDMIILGFICNDYKVGIYSVSVKVYSIVKTILSSVLVVSIPRLSMLIGKKKKEDFSRTASDIYNTLLTVVVPAIVGIILLREQIIILLADQSYMDATSSLFILSIALFFCLGAWFWGQCILIPMKLEKIVFKVTMVSSLVNIVFNFILIPFGGENAAALTTLIAEALSFIWCRIVGINLIDLKETMRTLAKVIIGCLGIVASSYICRISINNEQVCLTLTILISVAVYGVIEMILKNECIIGICRQVINKKH